ncbi:hypothetical protein [Methanobrevibacter filiformis]|uniref:Uncharacterized protein n=1 Tax=Methanobrevibacter filiformis TaxID=55758 RepID=A0A165Z9Z3_9EURY|nr:hypothetical protein [Methanobrevibacter filiformis]KZX10454.1 hypothetical protein MBFIL_17530 [Methanobrevibacter filiformis]
MKEIKINIKQIGRKHPIITKNMQINQNLVNKINNNNLILEDLIEEIVKIEVEEFKSKQKESEDLENNILKYLSTNEITAQSETGKIAISKIQNQNEVKENEAIETAILAFKDGIYFVFIDDKKIENIDDEIVIEEDSEIMFLRLTMLAGGIF